MAARSPYMYDVLATIMCQNLGAQTATEKVKDILHFTHRGHTTAEKLSGPQADTVVYAFVKDCNPTLEEEYLFLEMLPGSKVSQYRKLIKKCQQADDREQYQGLVGKIAMKLS